MIVEVDISSDVLVDAIAQKGGRVIFKEQAETRAGDIEEFVNAIASGDIVLAQALAPRLFESDADAFAADLALSRLRRAA